MSSSWNKILGTDPFTSNAVLYADATFAATNFTLANGNNTFTAIAKDSYGRRDTNSITVNLPATNSYGYDFNGNLTNDTIRSFAYDDENQLTSVYVTNLWRSDFVYDGKLRRRIERDYSWNGSSWIQTNEIHFIYDGYVVIQERDANNLPKVTYTRGNDLSGSLQGAGGIGGLLARTDNSQLIIGSSSANAYYHADGNGNVTMLINSYQAIVAKYLYDPFGNTLSLNGSLASANIYRFSSKEWNDTAGLYYYLYRYYDPILQRWLNRDPLGELGGLNLYAFVRSSPINLIDLIGLAGCGEKIGKSGHSRYVFTDPHVGWTAVITLEDYGGSAQAQAIQSININWTANVSVLCNCPCGIKNGTRVSSDSKTGWWATYNVNALPLGIPVVSGVANGISKLIAKGLQKIIGPVGVTDQDTLTQINKTINSFAVPTSPYDGGWKDGKSPCDQ
jgi:RHS repeat-associated protein